MAHRIEVCLKTNLKDALGQKTLKRAKEDLNLPVQDIRTYKVYLVEMELSESQLEDIAKGPFSDPVIQHFTINTPIASKIAKETNQQWQWVIEVGFRPGVTDNEGKTAKEAIELLIGRRLKQDEGVYTSTGYLVMGSLNEAQAHCLATDLLANDLIQRTTIAPFERLGEDYGKTGSPFFFVPRVREETKVEVLEFDLISMSDDDLVKLSRERVLVLSLEEMKILQAHMKDLRVIEERKKIGLGPRYTDCELEALAQTWSEHCKHKIFNAKINYKRPDGEEEIDSLFNTYIKGATQKIRKQLDQRDWCLSVFKDNAGVVSFTDELNVAFKVETHNSPSALDPYGGALTGIVGVNRDPFGTGLGAKLVFNTDVFCFGPPDYDKPIPKGLLHPKRIFEGVREGVEHGGNQSGIPTVNGSIVFDQRYLGKPLVFCGTGGIMPKNIGGRPSYEKKAMPGDAIVMCGGRIGKDGIHGATFSSEELHEGSPATAVQIGDPITQKKMTDFLLRARDLGLYNSITDNGAGGLSSSVGEMALESGGFELHLDRAPLKYPGLQPWEILVSEAQERMTVAVPQEKLDEFLKLSEKMGVESTVLGTFTDSGKYHCLYEGKTVAYLDMDFIHDGVPQMHLTAIWEPPRHEEPDFQCPNDLGGELKTLLSRFDICSKEYVVRQYDHEVQGGSVIKPLCGATNDGPSDAAILRPDLTRLEGLVVSHGICPRFSDIDTYYMVCAAVDEAVRNALCVGAKFDEMSGLDNFCWCDPVQSEKTPDGHYKLAQLVRANKALYDICTTYMIPCISGKDSMKNDATIGGVKISIPPTLLFSLIGKIDDVRKAITMDVKSPGDLIYVLGTTYPELGASEYFVAKGFTGNSIPKVRIDEAAARYKALSKATSQGLISSCHDCSDGGLGVCLAEKAFSGNLGMDIDLSAVPAEEINRVDHLLFSESQSRFVVTVRPENKAAFEDIMSDSVISLVGEVSMSKRLVMTYDGKKVINEPVEELKRAWQSPLQW